MVTFTVTDSQYEPMSVTGFSDYQETYTSSVLLGGHTADFGLTLPLPVQLSPCPAFATPQLFSAPVPDTTGWFAPCSIKGLCLTGEHRPHGSSHPTSDYVWCHPDGWAKAPCLTLLPRPRSNKHNAHG